MVTDDVDFKESYFRGLWVWADELWWPRCQGGLLYGPGLWLFLMKGLEIVSGGACPTCSAVA